MKSKHLDAMAGALLLQNILVILTNINGVHDGFLRTTFKCPQNSYQGEKKFMISFRQTIENSYIIMTETVGTLNDRAGYIPRDCNNGYE